MRLHGTVFSASASTRPLRGWAKDADDEDRLVEFEFRVQGRQVIAVPVNLLDEQPIADVPNANAGHAEIPRERAVPLAGDDFT